MYRRKDTVRKESNSLDRLVCQTLRRSYCSILGTPLGSRGATISGPIPAFKSALRSFIGTVGDHKSPLFGGPSPPRVYADLSIRCLFSGERFISNIWTWMLQPRPLMKSFDLPMRTDCRMVQMQR